MGIPPTPATGLSTTAPSGPVVSAAPCCPDVATFEGSTGARASYFGFDDKTNLVPNIGVDEYWIPPTDAKALPGSKETRDGARWVSVGVGREAQVQINFGGTFTAACLGNCTFVVDPATVADVTSGPPSASGAIFKIKGKAAGEASVKVMCDGKLRGYFHVWCAQPVVLNLDICTLKTATVGAATYSTATIRATANEIFRQALISFSVRDLGIVDISGDTNATTAEAAATSATKFTSSTAIKAALHTAANAVLLARSLRPPPPALTGAGATLNPPTPIPSGPPPVLPRTGAYRLYVYIPTAVRVSAAGSVLNVGSSPAFTYFQSAGASENSIAHELGHCLGLHHPSTQNSSDTSAANAAKLQFPAHLLATEGSATTAIPQTNTEPVVTAAAAKGNVMSSDPLNLMGYWGKKIERKPMRYAQWKTCSRS